jgi:hypothetical protein
VIWPFVLGFLAAITLFGLCVAWYQWDDHRRRHGR